ncbi:ankyrin repeat domain-containing protein [Hydrogenophaga sp. RWCD_12]|uniref:ankyrin repeat domain-containing protein n=1 Tax=Hydrogenophaga sp. RWCD_12 TaxID=3391190 RepID=UPI0039852B14
MSDSQWTRLSAAQAHAWLRERPDALVLDAREAAHHLAAHLDGSVRLHRDNHEALLTTVSRRRPVFIYCYHGHASQTWAGMFTDFGFAEVADLVGGWAALGLGNDSRGPVPLADWGPPSVGVVVPPALADWLQSQGFDPARPEAPGVHGNTPLMHAAWRGAQPALDQLLALKVPLDAVNSDGNNALWLACVHGEPENIRLLAAHGVPIDHANFTGATALMYAASSGKAGVVATLLSLGANPHLVTQDDFSALDMAASLDCLQLLRTATRRRSEPETAP